MDVWEVPQSSRSDLDRGFLMDVGPKLDATISQDDQAMSSMVVEATLLLRAARDARTV
jgi:hypothetical protein